MPKKKVMITDDIKTKYAQTEHGVYHGYKPNRLSLYLLYLNTGRYDDLRECLVKDMEKYRIENSNIKIEKI